MQLAYFSTHVANFGDDLNADIWPALAPSLFEDDDPAHAFVGIGTIIGMPAIRSPRIEVFSTGAGNDPVSNWATRTITYHCVRGPVTARLCGLEADRVITDGALLTPLVPGFPARASGGGGTVVIPHFQTAACGDWARACRLAGMHYLDPRRPTREVVAMIAGADRVLTESLHGAILADAYGVGWSVFAASRNFDPTKWIDWCASLGLTFEMTMVPPPSAELLLRFGKRAEPYGSTRSYALADALASYGSRLDGRVTSERRQPARELARALLLGVKPFQVLLGFSPARTAEALHALAARAPSCSPASTRQALQTELQTRLHALATRHASTSAR